MSRFESVGVVGLFIALVMAAAWVVPSISSGSQPVSLTGAFTGLSFASASNSSNTTYTCYSSAYPACGGTCPSGLSCQTNATNACDCLNATSTATPTPTPSATPSATPSVTPTPSVCPTPVPDATSVSVTADSSPETLVMDRTYGVTQNHYDVSGQFASIQLPSGWFINSGDASLQTQYVKVLLSKSGETTGTPGSNVFHVGDVITLPNSGSAYHVNGPASGGIVVTFIRSDGTVGTATIAITSDASGNVYFFIPDKDSASAANAALVLKWSPSLNGFDASLAPGGIPDAAGYQYTRVVSSTPAYCLYAVPATFVSGTTVTSVTPNYYAFNWAIASPFASVTAPTAHACLNAATPTCQASLASCQSSLSSSQTAMAACTADKTACQSGLSAALSSSAACSTNACATRSFSVTITVRRGVVFPHRGKVFAPSVDVPFNSLTFTGCPSPALYRYSVIQGRLARVKTTDMLARGSFYLFRDPKLALGRSCTLTYVDSYCTLAQKRALVATELPGEDEGEAPD